MNRKLFIRWGLLIVIVWIGVGFGAWMCFDAADPLVGVRNVPQEATDVFADLASKDLGETLSSLSSGTMWGIRRDGSPLPSPEEIKAAEAKPPPVVWRVLATRIKGKDRQLLIQVDNKQPLLVNEGESLPDGAVVKSVSTRAYLMVTPDGVEQLIQLNYE